MANIRINSLPPEASPSASDVVPIDGVTTRKATLTDIVTAGRPLASQAEAEAGTDAEKAMTPLTTAQAIVAVGAGQFASAAQGATADSALQPEAIDVTVQAHSDLLDSVAAQAIVTGDILYGSGTDTLSRLPAGTNGQVIRLAGGVPSWTTASGLGDLLAANNLSDVDDTDEVLDNLGFGDAGKDISALSIAADVRNYLDVAPYVATRTALKALDTSKDIVVRLTESGREGVFQWTAGNFSTQIAADTQEGIYVKADAIAATVGAWVRVTNGEWFADWFGIPADPAAGLGGGSEVQCHTQMTAMINLGNIVKPSEIVFADQVYTLGAAIPEFSWQVILTGQRGTQSSIIVKRYVEASAVRGILAFNNFGFTVRFLGIRATSGSGGSGISAILTVTTAAAGRTHLLYNQVSCGDFCNYSLYINGSTNTTPAGPSYRGTNIIGGEYFGAASAAIQLVSVHHVFGVGVFAAGGTGSGGSGLLGLAIFGDAVAYNDDVQMHGIFSGNISLNQLQRSTFVSPVTGQLSAASTVTYTTWEGPLVAGASLSLNWGVGCKFNREFTRTRAVLADDTATSITLPTGYTAYVVSLSCTTVPSSGGAPSGSIWVRPNAAPPVNIGMASTTGITFTSGILSGTTGVDGQFSISTHTDGKLYLENRSGSSRVLSVDVLNMT